MKEPDNCIPRFFLKSVEDQEKTKETGNVVFKDVEYVEIIIPNSRDTSVQPVSEQHKARWPEHYKAFKDHREAPIVGTPLTEWAAISPAMVRNLESANVRTVEALAEMPEHNLQRFGPDTLKTIQKARAYVESKKDGNVSKLIEERDELKQKLDDARAEIAQLKKPRAKKK